MQQELPIGQRLLKARYSCDRDEVVKICELMLKSRPDNVDLHRIAARMLVEAGEDASAKEFWNRILMLRPYDLEALCHSTRMRFLETEDLSAATAAITGDAPAAIKSIIRETIESPLVPRDANQDVRIIVNCGVSFSGSTLLDRILGSLPGTRSIGESHWLLKTYVNKVSAPIDFASSDFSGVPHCSVCGPRCNVLSMDFRAQLAADRTNWYYKIAKRLETRILIAADKNLPKLVDNDPLLRMDCVVLFKSPLQAWQSQYNKLPKGADSAFYDSELNKYISVWQRSYSAILDDFKPAGRVIFVQFDDFSTRPAEILKSITEQLSLPHDVSVLHRAVPGHAIGGNSNANKRLRESDYGVEILPLPYPELPEKHAQQIAAAVDMQNVYSRLLERSQDVSVGSKSADN